MKKILAGGIILAGLLISWGCEKASGPETSNPGGMPRVEKPSPNANRLSLLVLPHAITDAEVGQQAKCPVMGTEITVDKNTLSAEYKGRVYYFCCGGCPDEFKADPEKFAK